MTMLLKRFRILFGQQYYGAVAVIGDPLKVTPGPAYPDEIARGIALPDDSGAAMDAYVEQLSIVQKIAVNKPCQKTRQPPGHKRKQIRRGIPARH